MPDKPDIQENSGGHKEVFEQLYKELYKKLCYFACKIVNDEEDAKDIVEGVFIKLWPRMANFPEVSNITPFLFIATKHDCMSFLRHEVVKRKHRAEPMVSDDPDRYEEYRIQSEVLQKVNKYIEQFPDQTKRVFILSFIENMSRAEVAAKLGISENTVRNLKAIAIAKLRSILGVQKPL